MEDIQQIKVVFHGSRGVGKSSLRFRYREYIFFEDAYDHNPQTLDSHGTTLVLLVRVVVVMCLD